MSENFTSKVPTEIPFINRFDFKKVVNVPSDWNFEICVRKKINVRTFVIVGFKISG